MQNCNFCQSLNTKEWARSSSSLVIKFRCSPGHVMNRLAVKASDAVKLKEIWLLFLTSGIAMIVLGTLSLSFSLTSTLATILLFGLLLAAGSIFQIGSALWARHWRGFVLHLLLGI